MPSRHDDPLALANMVCFAVYSAGHAFTRAYKPLLDALGLTYPQYLVMVVLWEQDGQTVGAIGERLKLDSSTLTPLLKRLEAAGYVRRERDPEDERQVRVRLAEPGRALKEKAKAIPASMLRASGQSARDLLKLKAEIAALRDALDASTAAET
jgi:MarR family transcriptional regulator, organic hydroperoxide resistance regulator